MTGIILVVIFLVWLVFVTTIAIVVAKRFKSFYVKCGLGLFVGFVLLPLPLFDEMVAQSQFKELCRTGAVLHIDEQGIRGRKIKLVFEPANALVRGLAVPVLGTRVKFKDAITGEEFGSYGEYTAEGGILIHAIGISESDSPIWMSRSYCSPDIGVEQMANIYMFELVRK